MAGKSKRIPGQLVRCTKCGSEKPWQIGTFRSSHGKPSQPCIPCDNALRALNALQNIERERASARKRTSRWRKRNPDKVQAANRRPRKLNKVAARARCRSWKKAHPESGVTAYHQRKASLRRLPSGFTRTDWLYCLDYWGNRCCICEREAGNGYVLAQEHWIAIADPRADNPGHVPTNIVPMCHARAGVKGGCNNSKWTRDAETWLRDIFGMQVAEDKLAKVKSYFEIVARIMEAMA